MCNGSNRTQSFLRFLEARNFSKSDGKPYVLILFLKVHLKTVQMLYLKDIEFSTTAQNMHQDVAHTVTHSNDFGLRSDKCHNTPKVAKK